MVNRKILIPLDKHLMTTELLEFIMRLAAKNDFSLLFLDNARDSSQKIPFEQLDEIEEELEMDYKVIRVEGNWIVDINEYAESEAVDLVALTVDENKTSELLQGVARPLLLFPKNWEPKEIKKIGFACDNNSFQDSTVLTILWYLAIELKAQVYIIHISPKPIDRWTLKQSVEDSIEFYLQDVEHFYEFIHSDNVAESLVRFTEEKGLDLLATMPRNHQINRLENGGKVTGELIERAPVPIITID